MENMHGGELIKVSTAAFRKSLGDDLRGIIAAGSLPNNDFSSNWSDLDLILVVNEVCYDVKVKILKTIRVLEKKTGVKHGINVVSVTEVTAPKDPAKNLDGKTLQALLECHYDKTRLVYTKFNVSKLYFPNKQVVKEYTAYNMSLFRLRNRKKLISLKNSDFKEIVKREIRACFTVLKLAVQYHKNIKNFNKSYVLECAIKIFPDYDFSCLNNFNKYISEHKDVNKTILKKQLQTAEYFIENFTNYFIETK